MKLNEILTKIPSINHNMKNEALEKFHQLAIPLNSLGKLQESVLTLCGITETLSPEIKKRAVVVFCADNGIIAQGVSQVGAEVTTAVAQKLCTNDTIMCKMAEFASCDVIPVDIGMITPISHPKILQKSIQKGTEDFTKIPAMSEASAIKAIEVGISVGLNCKNEGYQLIIPGEMSIGNTTTSTAMTCLLLNKTPEELVGRGAGLSEEGLQRKINAIKKGITLHKKESDTVLSTLSKVGGFDIAGMIGLILACAYTKTPCVIDGYISSLAAYCAITLCPSVRDFCIFSHETAEPGGRALLHEMKISPLIHGNLALGEGSGAVTLLPLLDMSLYAFSQGITFSDMGIAHYTPK